MITKLIFLLAFFLNLNFLQPIAMAAEGGDCQGELTTKKVVIIEKSGWFYLKTKAFGNSGLIAEILESNVLNDPAIYEKLNRLKEVSQDGLPLRTKSGKLFLIKEFEKEHVLIETADGSLFRIKNETVITKNLLPAPGIYRNSAREIEYIESIQVNDSAKIQTVHLRQFIATVRPELKIRDEVLAKIKADSLTFIEVPEGEYILGKDGKDSDQWDYEKKKVNIKKFKLSKYDTNQFLYWLVTKKNPIIEAGKEYKEFIYRDKPDYWKSPDGVEMNLNHPVIFASYEDVHRDFLPAIKKFFPNARLPFEEELEAAGRGNPENTHDYSFGDNPTEDLLNKYSVNVNNSNGQLQEIGTKEANELGLHDMHGLVWKLTESKLNKTGSSLAVRGGSWNYHAEYCRSALAVRGGSWVNHARICRSAQWYFVGPGERNYDVGLRLVLE